MYENLKPLTYKSYNNEYTPTLFSLARNVSIIIRAEETNEAGLNFHSFGFRKQYFGHAKPPNNKDFNVIRSIPNI